MSQYLALVGHGYDGDVIRKWTKRHAADEIARRHLNASPAVERLGPSARPTAARNAVRRRLPKLAPPGAVTPSEARAAGLGQAAADLLASISASHKDAAAIPQSKRGEMTQICMDVLSVMGMGTVDRILLNHFIRDVLIRMSDRHRHQAVLPISKRLCHLFARPTFSAEALAALGEHIKRVAEGHAAPERLQVPRAMTEAWIRDGGWKAYWLALWVVRTLQPRFKRGVHDSPSLDAALAAALGFTSVR